MGKIQGRKRFSNSFGETGSSEACTRESAKICEKDPRIKGYFNSRHTLACIWEMQRRDIFELRIWGSGVRISSGAPFRDTLLTPKLAVLPMQAVASHPPAARLEISIDRADELSALSR